MVEREGPDLPRVGGAPCLDFVNTLASFAEPGARDVLRTYGDLVRRGVADERAGRRLIRRAQDTPRDAERALRSARRLRRILYDLFAAGARGERAAPAAVTAFNRALAPALARRRLAATADGWAWRWDDPDHLERPLWEVLASAVDVLTGPDLDRLKQCPAPDGCGWLFLDVSKNRSRRWCSMTMCGNAAKARRFAARHG